MKAFEFFAARDSRHALALLAEHGPGARVLAGGTDLLADLKRAAQVPEVVIDISRAADLRGIEVTPEGLRIGALATHTEILRSPLIREHAPALADAAHSVGSVQIRNFATIGGNLVTCVPSMDGGPVLVSLEAKVKVAGPAGERQLALEDFFVGPRQCRLGSGELLLEIVVPAANFGKPCAFRKFGLRKGQALALVNVAASTRVSGGANAFEAPRIALGAVAPTVMRARRAEDWLEARAATPEAIAEAGRIAADEAQPISDFRASAEYRRELVAVLTRRALEAACDAAAKPVQPQ